MTEDEIISAFRNAEQRARIAEAQVEQLKKERDDARTTIRTEREGNTLRSALLAAGVAEKGVTHAVAIVRAESTLLDFAEESGEFKFADFAGRTFRNAAELGRAFVERFPSFSAEHSEAVKAAGGQRDHNAMSAVDMAEVGLEAALARSGGAGGTGASSSAGATESGNGIVAQMAHGLAGAGRR